MNRGRRNQESGFVNAIVLVVVTLILLGHFNIDAKTVVESPSVSENLAYAWELTVSGIRQIISAAAELIRVNVSW